jgi:DNA-binding beta-propeller fold protein YncE
MIDIWSGASGKQLGSIQLDSSPQKITINQDTKTAYVTEGNGSIQVINLLTNQIIATIPGTFEGSPAINSDTNLVYVGDSGNVLNVINGTNNQVVTQIPLAAPATSIAANPATNLVYVAEASTGEVQVINASTNQIVQTFTGFTELKKVAVDPVTNKIYILSQNPNSSEPSNMGLLTTLDGNTNTILTQQTFPATDLYSADLTVNPVNHQVTVNGSNYSGASMLFDENGNLLNIFGPFQYDGGLQGGATVNPDTGNVYESSYYSGVLILNPNGTSIQVIPAPCVEDMDMTNL